MADDGSLETTDTVPELIDRPAGQTGPNDRCQYDITLPSSVTANSRTLELRDGATTRISGNLDTNDPINHQINAPYDIEFDLNFTISVPTYNGDNDPGTALDESTQNAFAGARIQVQIAVTSASPPGCSADIDEDWTVGPTGTVAGSAVTLLGGVPGQDGRCVYTTTFAANERGGTKLERQGAMTRDVDLDTQPFTVEYHAPTSNFLPNATMAVPFVDADGNNVNDLTGTQITITYAPLSNPAQNAGCATTETDIFRIENGGSATTGGMTTRTTTPSLVDRPTGVDARCRYVATLADPITIASYGDLVLATAPTVEFGRFDPIAVRYSGDTFFSLALTITMPDIDRYGQAGTNFFEGTIIPVAYEPVSGSHQRCSSAGSFDYVVAASGTAAPPGGRASLVDVPENEVDSCSYVVSFEPTVSSDDGATPIWTLTNQDTSSVTLNTDANSATRQYGVGVIKFVPDVAVSVPPLTHLGTANVFAGARIEVSFARSGSNAQCTPASVSLTYAVQANGDVALVSGTLPELVDRPDGALDTRCTYDVATSASVGSASVSGGGAGAAELEWTLTPQSGNTASVGMDVVAVAADYGAGDVTFTPQIAISVPQYNADDDPATSLVESNQNWFAGETFSVGIARASGPPAADCSADVTLTFTVQPGGTVTSPDAAGLELVDYPAGAAASGASARCVYRVSFPQNEVGGTMLSRIATGLDTETRADDRAAEATYHARTTFAPNLNLAVPFFDTGGDSNNDLSGVNVGVTYRLATTNPAQHSGCSGSGAAMAASETYTIGTGGSAQDGGQTSFTGSNTAASLVDRPLGSADRCRYVADFDNTISTSTPVSLTLTSADGSVFDAADELDVDYSAGTPFDIAITLRVPQFDREGMAGTNFFAGEVIPVAFSLSSGPETGCSGAQTVEYVVQPGGTVTPRSGTVSFVDLPLDETENCVYLARFEEEVDSPPGASPVWKLSNLGADTQLISAAAAAAEREYQSGDIGFLPVVDISVPDFDGRTDGVSLFAGAAFRVTFSPADGPASGCSPPDVAVFTVDNNGDVSGTEPSLTDRPEGRTNRCSYSVSFSPSASSATGSELSWALSRQAGFGTSVRALARTVSASYALSRDITFGAGVRISVPQYNGDGDNSGRNAFAGLSFAVRFVASGGPTADCSARTVTYTVQPGGGVSGPASVVLVDRPMSGGGGGGGGRCVYSVEMPQNPVGSTRLVRSSAASTELSAGSVSLVVLGSYQGAESRFAPSVSVVLAEVDADRNGLHDLAGVTFEVGYARVSGSSNDCTDSASEVYVVADDGSVSLAQPPAVDQAQTPASLVDRPAGSVARCSYDVSYPDPLAAPIDATDPLGAPADPASQAAPVPLRSASASQISAGAGLTLEYAPPPPARVIPEPVPLMSANVGVSRLPVRVTVEVPLGNFETDDTFEVLVSVPGACGSDTFLFGGVAGSIGVAYAAEAIIRGVAVVVGEDTPHFNPQASYDLPPYVNGAGGREACAVRVTVLEAPPGCSLAGASGVDFRGRSYIQADWSAGLGSFDLAATYDCPGFVEGPERVTQGTVTLNRGWLTLPFNGETGTTPAEFLQMLGGAVTSMWLWDAASQSWMGWTARHGNLGLTSLTRGDVIMAYAHLDVTVSYSPADLLALPDDAGGLRLQAGFNLHIFGGDGPTSVASLVRQPSVVPVVFLWVAATQSWRYHLPGRQPIAGFEIPWFDTMNPGDTVFIYSLSAQPTTSAWG